MQTQLNLLIQLIAQSFNSELIENDIQLIPNGLQIITMEEEPTIITELYRAASQHDCDIMEYSMHSKMVADNDDNFITTLTFTFINIEN